MIYVDNSVSFFKIMMVFVPLLIVMYLLYFVSKEEIAEATRKKDILNKKRKQIAIEIEEKKRDRMEKFAKSKEADRIKNVARLAKDK